MLPDAVAEALGDVVAELTRAWQREKDVLVAESRAVVAEFTNKVASLTAEIAAARDASERRIAEALAQVKDGAPGERGENGKDADREQIAALVGEAVEKAVSSFPKPDQGQPGERGADGAPGKDADPEAVAALVDETVQKAVAALSVPKDGRDGEPGAKGADGVGLAGAVIDRAGTLVLTLTDGSTRDLGAVVGKDGSPGQNGADGAPGRDGFGFEDMTEELADDGRTIIRRYTRGEEVKEFRHRLSVVLDRGVYKAGTDYEPGDGVTFGGSFWIAQEKTSEKPGDGKAFRLAVKRGRDGKDGEKGGLGPKGEKGDPGRDGGKW